MDEKQVDMRELQPFQALFRCFDQVFGSDLCAPDLRRYEEFFTRDPGESEPSADRYFVLVNRSRVDVPVPGFQGVPYGVRTIIVLQLPRAKAEGGNACAVRQHHMRFHRYLSAFFIDDDRGAYKDDSVRRRRIIQF